MRLARDLADAVGRTPLIRLRAASEATGCEILGKAEFLNPGLIKARVARELSEGEIFLCEIIVDNVLSKLNS